MNKNSAVGKSGMTENSGSRSELAAKILKAMDGIRYGSLEIVIHDSQVVRFERHEKIRLHADIDSYRNDPQD